MGFGLVSIVSWKMHHLQSRRFEAGSATSHPGIVLWDALNQRAGSEIRYFKLANDQTLNLILKTFG